MALRFSGGPSRVHTPSIRSQPSPPHWKVEDRKLQGWSVLAETAQSGPSACDSICFLFLFPTAVCLTLQVNCGRGCFRSRVTHATTTLCSVLFLTRLSGEGFHSGSTQSTHHRSVLLLVRWVSELSLPVSARPRARPETFSFPARERTLRTRTRTLTRGHSTVTQTLTSGAHVLARVLHSMTLVSSFVHDSSSPPPSSSSSNTKRNFHTKSFWLHSKHQEVRVHVLGVRRRIPDFFEDCHVTGYRGQRRGSHVMECAHIATSISTAGLCHATS